MISQLCGLPLGGVNISSSNRKHATLDAEVVDSLISAAADVTDVTDVVVVVCRLFT